MSDDAIKDLADAIRELASAMRTEPRRTKAKRSKRDVDINPDDVTDIARARARALLKRAGAI